MPIEAAAVIAINGASAFDRQQRRLLQDESKGETCTPRAFDINTSARKVLLRVLSHIYW